MTLLSWPSIVASSPADNDQMRLLDSSGNRVAPLASDDRLATCIIFISSTCPISDSYAPEISRIAVQYSSAKITTYAVLVDNNLTVHSAAVYRSQYRLSCPVLMDPKHLLVAAAQANVTPEATVFDSSGRVIYRGRIDNKYVDFGIARQTATESDLRQVLDQVKRGDKITFKATKAIGCFIPPVAG